MERVQLRSEAAWPRRWRRESDRELARRLRALGCTEAQIRCHLAKGKVPLSLPKLRPSIMATQPGSRLHGVLRLLSRN